MPQVVFALTSLVELSEYTAIAESCTTLPTLNDVPGELMFRDLSVAGGGGGGGGGGVIDELPPPQFEAPIAEARMDDKQMHLKIRETRLDLLAERSCWRESVIKFV